MITLSAFLSTEGHVKNDSYENADLVVAGSTESAIWEWIYLERIKGEAESISNIVRKISSLTQKSTSEFNKTMVPNLGSPDDLGLES